MDPSSVLDMLLFLVFLGLSALFFAGEFAFFSASADELEVAVRAVAGIAEVGLVRPIGRGGVAVVVGSGSAAAFLFAAGLPRSHRLAGVADLR